MTVAEMSRRMSHAEYVEWGVYFARKAQRRELDQKMAKYRNR